MPAILIELFFLELGQQQTHCWAGWNKPSRENKIIRPAALKALLICVSCRRRELNSIDLQIYSIPGLQKQSWRKQIRAETLRQRWHLLAEHGPCTGHFCCSAASSKNWSFRFIHRKCCQVNNQRCGQSLHLKVFIRYYL